MMAEPSRLPDLFSGAEEADVPSVVEKIAALLAAASKSNDRSSSRSQKIEIVQKILDTMDFGSQKPQIVELLAECCYDQYKAVNDWNALESATEYYGELIEDTQEDDLADAARLAAGYARCMQERFMRGRNEQDLEQAIKFASESISKTRSMENLDSLPLFERLEILWLCMFTKVHQLDDAGPEDFSRMMQTAEELNVLAQNSRLGPLQRIEAMSNLGLTYQIKWDQQGGFESLEKSVTLGREVLNQLPTDVDADAQIDALSNLAFRLQRAYRCFIDEGKVPTGMTISQAGDLFHDALGHLIDSMSLRGERLLAGPENTLTFVMYIRNLPVQQRAELLGKCSSVLRTSVRTIREYCKISSQYDQRDCLSTFYGISRYAAAAALQAGGTPCEALNLLEEGRAIVTNLQEDITDNELLRSLDENLAIEHTQLLKTFSNSFTSQSTFHERQSNMKRLNELQERISELTGLPKLPGQLSEKVMIEMAEDRDIVVINVTDLLSHAIIVTKKGLRVVDLPNLDENQLSEDSWEIQTRLAQEENQAEVFPDLHANLSKFLRDLWKNLVKPVLDDLGYKKPLTKLDSWPQITWIVNGILCLYPIHAAGLGLHKEANTMNRVISSYATSLSSLLRLYERSKNAVGVNEFIDTVIVSMSETIDRYPLSGQEAATIVQNFPSSKILENCTTEDVLAAIAERPRIVHFSCHGEVDYDQPLLSKLLTKNWQTSPLTVAQLQMLKNERSELAYLSACFTANAGVENMQDEGNHLAGALQLAGFPHVIGSSWYVGEPAALEVTTRFYLELANAGRDWPKEVAKALHFAVIDFRETTRTAGNNMRGDPVSWTPFLHFGT